MTLVATPRKILPKSRFRIELDGIGDLRATTVGAVKRTFNLIETEEGGADTTAEITPNGFRWDAILVERPLTDDMALADWAEDIANGIDDKKNGVIYQLDAEGKEICRWRLEEITMADYQDFEGDAKAKEGNDAMTMERCTMRPRIIRKRELLI